MYHAKQHRRGSIEFFREELNTRERERAQWVAELQAALQGKQFELLFQPRAALPDGAVVAVEALLYWRHPRHGLIAAARFLPDVADSLLLEQVCEWMLGAACAEAAAWRAGSARTAAQVARVVMAVDLALLQIRPELAARVLAHLRACKLPAGWLELEIPEHLLLDTRDSAAVLRQLKAAGVRLTVDDFGSAGAALAMLRDLPFDAIKIDRAFVRAIGVERGTDMAAAIVHLGRALGLRVLAQGVHSAEQLAVLKSLGCDEYQGELLSPPLSAAGMLALLQARPTNQITSPNTSQAALSTPKKRGQSR
nr:EAL domain-containing protein [Massilia mucilaginosa]